MLMSTELPCGIKMNSCSYVLDLLTRDPLHLLKGWASGWSRPSHLLMCQPVSLLLWQRFSIPVLAPPRSAYFACLSLLTHLIKIISLLEVRSMHELCSDWYAPYTGSIAPYSLSRGNPLKFTLFRNIHSWICAAQRLHARTSVTSYISVNIYNCNSRLAHFNALWMEYIRLLRTGIMAGYPVMSTSQGTYVRIEQASEAIRVTYEICRAGAGGGARTGIENRCPMEYGGLQDPYIRSCSPRGLWYGRLVLTAHIHQISFFGSGRPSAAH